MYSSTAANSNAVSTFVSNPENFKSATAWYNKFGKRRLGAHNGQRSSSVPPSPSRPDQDVYDATAFSVDAAPYEPRFLVDSGAKRHICNDMKYFSSFTAHRTFIRSLDTNAECLGWGTIDLKLKKRGGGVSILTCSDVLYVPSALTCLIAALELAKHPIIHDLETSELRYRPSRRHVAEEFEHNDLPFVHLQHDEPAIANAVTAVSNRRQPATPEVWHMRLGHPSPQALQAALFKQGIVMPRNLLPTTVQCELCAVYKATRVNSREPVVPLSPQPFYEMGVDLCVQEPSFSGLTVKALLKCTNTNFTFGKSFKSRAQGPILQWLLEIVALCRNKHSSPV